MTIKIIKRGMPPVERKFHTVCCVCRTEIEFLQGDAKLQSDQRDGDYLTLQCPVCFNTLTVQANSYIKTVQNDGCSILGNW